MRRALLATLIAALASGLLLPGAAGAQERASTLQDRRSVDVTIYNCGTGLVHDLREVDLQAGRNDIAWEDVSPQMNPASAILTPQSNAGPIQVLEQTFSDNPLDTRAFEQRYIGKTVAIVYPPLYRGAREVRVRATLLSAGSDGLLLQTAAGIQHGVYAGYVVYPDPPRDFRDRPTLVLDLQSAKSGPRLLDLSYLTAGMNWSADYAGVLSADETHLNLHGLVTLSNTSGEAYRDAHLQLVAGSVNCLTPQPHNHDLLTIAPRSSAFQAAPFTQTNAFEYHLYTLGRTTTIAQNQTKQVSLLTARNVPVTTTLELRGDSYYYQGTNANLGQRIPVSAYVTFKNRGGDLGIPLPAGTVRMYERDSAGRSLFVGADQIEHTPKNQTVRLNLGNSFDVTARKKQTAYVELGKCASESSYEVAISNAKDIAQHVLVIEPIPGDWQIVSENLPHVKTSAFTANWEANVPADGSTTLDYTVRTKWSC